MNSTTRAVTVLMLVVSASGCASLGEAARGFAGVSTKVLERGRPEALSRVWKESPDVCVPKIESVLNDIGAYVYARDDRRRLIAVYVSATDTTPVGIFWEPAREGQTAILVSSPSRFAKEKLFTQIFTGLENPGVFARKPAPQAAGAGSPQQ